jgi:WD40 repeat protein
MPTAPKIDATKTHVVKELKHGNPLISCRFDPTGRYVFYGAQDYQVWRWDTKENKKIALVGTDSWVRGIAFSQDGSQTITAGYDGRLVWWETAATTPKPLRTLDAHHGWVRAIAVSPDGKLLASVGNDKLVKIWNTADGSAVRSMSGHEHHVYNVAFHPDGSRLVTGDLKCHLFEWDTATGKLGRRLQAKSLYKYDGGFKADIGGVRAIDFSDDGKQLAVSGITNVTNAFACVGNPSVVVFDWKSGKETAKFLAKSKPRAVAWGLALHPSGITIGAAGGPGGGFLYFWKAGESNEFHQIKMKDSARDLDLSPDRIHLATAHYDGVVRISRMTAKA